MHGTRQAATVAWLPIHVLEGSQKRREMETQKLPRRASSLAARRTKTTACSGRHFTQAAAARCQVKWNLGAVGGAECGKALKG